MTNQTIAKELGMDPRSLERESLKTYLEKQLHLVEGELFSLSIKYGIKDFDEFNRKVLAGKIHEDENWEDYFKFENLEAKRDKILKILNSL